MGRREGGGGGKWIEIGGNDRGRVGKGMTSKIRDKGKRIRVGGERRGNGKRGGRKTGPGKRKEGE